MTHPDDPGIYKPPPKISLWRDPRLRLNLIGWVLALLLILAAIRIGG